MTRHGKAPATARPDTDDAGETVEHKGRCPFCAISRSFPPVDHLGDPKRIAQILDARKTNPPSQIIYSGESVLAFLDIQPLTWGHTLVIPRRHRVKMGDLGAADGAEVSCVCCCFASTEDFNRCGSRKSSMYHSLLVRWVSGTCLSGCPIAKLMNTASLRICFYPLLGFPNTLFHFILGSSLKLRNPPFLPYVQHQQGTFC